MRMDKGKPFMHIMEDGGSAPTFSEAFLYDTVGKYEARFILGVAEEYEHIIEALGPEAVRAILGVKPVLVQRLDTGTKIVEWLKDARSDEDLRRSAEFPSQVILDDNAAEAVWSILHDEYVRYFDLESMDPNHLRTYLLLTERLGQWEKDQKQKADEGRAEMTERAQKRREEKKALATQRREAREAVVAALRDAALPGAAENALALYDKAWDE